MTQSCQQVGGLVHGQLVSLRGFEGGVAGSDVEGFADGGGFGAGGGGKAGESELLAGAGRSAVVIGLRRSFSMSWAAMHATSSHAFAPSEPSLHDRGVVTANPAQCPG